MKNALFFSLCLSISLVACGDDSGRTTTDTGDTSDTGSAGDTSDTSDTSK